MADELLQSMFRAGARGVTCRSAAWALEAGTIWNCARRGSAETIIAVAAKNDAPANGSYAEWHLLKLPSASAPMEPR